jgi:mono/diheme cytochrome c family protein
MTRLALLAAAMLLGACAGTHPTTPTRAEIEARGAVLAQNQCSACHAVGRTGDSPAPEAPPFRALSPQYRVATLEQALKEGISAGHPAMPTFHYTTADADALIAYLQSIQERP